MTDNEIIKALECFALDKDFDETQCIGCAFEHQFCTANMSVDIAKQSIDLINRQKAAIDRLSNFVSEERCREIAREMIPQFVRQARAEAVKEFAKYLINNYATGGVIAAVDVVDAVAEWGRGGG